MKVWLLLILQLFFGTVCHEIDAHTPYFRHYTNQQGLSYNTVYCSLQDSRGFMWFGTENGLNRFDGYTFYIYRRDSSGGGLPDNRINSLFEDSTGRLWICTSGGVCIYKPETDSFISFVLSPDQLSLFPVYQVIEDGDGNIWINAGENLIRYSLFEETYTIFSGQDYFYPYDLTLNQDGEVIIAGVKDLYLYEREKKDFRQIRLLTPEEQGQQVEITKIIEIPDLGILFGTNKAGLKLWRYVDRQTETIIPDIQVRVITASSPSVYWIGTESGLYIYHALTRTVSHFTKSLVNEYALSDNAIYCISKDSEGGMWTGTFFGGISYLPEEYVSFNRFIGGKTHPDMLGNAVREIISDQNGYIWIGTEDNGINRYDPESGEMFNFSLNNPHYPLSATNIHGLFAEGNRLWIGTFNKGIDLLDIPSGKIIRRYTLENTEQGLMSDFILCFARTTHEGLLTGTSVGVAQYIEADDTFSPWKDIYGLVRQIYEDHRGWIWIVTTQGVYRYQSVEDSLAHYTARYPDIMQSIGDNNCTSVFEDSNRSIWVTTMYGLSRYDPVTDQFRTVQTNYVSPGYIAYRILEDDTGYFWISTAGGLVRFNPGTYESRLYSYKEGLHEVQFNYSSAYKSPDGIMYMGTINGMISFDPSRFREDTFIPPVYISSIEFPDDRDKKYDNIAKSAMSSGILKLPYHSATFTVKYVALEYTAPEAIQYAYKLEDVDKDWILMGQSREVTFANLSPGEYLFKVRSTNSGGHWQNNEQQFQIIIVPPFWMTSWAIAVYVLFAISLVYVWYSFKKRRLMQKHTIKQEMFEAKKEKELYDAKIQFFTFITHEIRTPLTLIKAPLEKIINSDDGTPETRKNLKLIETNMDRLLDLSSQLLDFRKTESKGFKLNFVETEIILWLKTFVDKYTTIIEQNNKLIDIRLPENSFIIPLDRDAFSKIMDNLMTNAIKYSERYIRLELILSESEVAISVVNDGLVIPENERKKIFNPFYRVKPTEHLQGSGIGLSLAYSLAEFHHGTLQYIVTEDRKNCFVLSLPLVQESIYPKIPAEQRKTVTNIPKQKSSKLSILIVEDQLDMRRFIAHELQEQYYVWEAENGKKALKILEYENINMIISDVMMPVMDGFDLCNRVKNDVHYSHIPFIILTAQHNLQSRLQGLNIGADAYIEKPFSLELLTSQISNLFRNREYLNRAYQQKPSISSSSLAQAPVDQLFIEKINNYLEENLSNEHFNVETLATLVGMSTSSLYRKVKGLAGVSPVDFIRIFRLKKAVGIMEEGETRINEIAYRTGFSSPAYFSTCFQKQYGKSPTEFMKTLRL